MGGVSRPTQVPDTGAGTPRVRGVPSRVQVSDTGGRSLRQLQVPAEGARTQRDGGARRGGGESPPEARGREKDWRCRKRTRWPEKAAERNDERGPRLDTMGPVGSEERDLEKGTVTGMGASQRVIAGCEGRDRNWGEPCREEDGLRGLTQAGGRGRRVGREGSWKLRTWRLRNGGH